MNDLRFAFRQLIKNSGGTVVILATLALVIGTVSLTFGVVQHEVVSWMPFPKPEQVVRFWRSGGERPREDFPSAVYAAAARGIQGIEAMAALGYQESKVLTGEGDPQSLSVQSVTASVIEVAGVQPRMGRWFTPEEQRAGREDLLVISFGLWHSVFQGSQSVIGKVVQLNNVACTIIGVMPEGFERNALFHGLDAWFPRDFGSPSQKAPGIRIVARRKNGVSASQLKAEAATAMPLMLAAFDAARGQQRERAVVGTLPLHQHPGGNDVAAIASGVSICVFAVAIAAFNVANILLGRILTRRHEFAVRFSLGAGRGRIMRQLLIESVLLSLIGAAAGLVGAIWVSGWSAAHGVRTQFSPAVLGWTAVASVVIGIAVGWLPAWRATRGDFLTDLKESSGGGTTGGSGRHRLRNFLVVGQVAMATALCLAAGLLVRSYLERQRFDPGFDPSRFITVNATLNQELYGDPEKRMIYTGQALDHIRGLPGVEDAAFSSDRTVDRSPFPMGFRLEGEAEWPRGQSVKLSILSPNYLPMIGVPVLRGRGIGDSDRRGAPAIALVNQSFVDRYFPEADPIGKRIAVPIEANPDWLAIAGVVPDRRNLSNSEEVGPEAYLCAHQFAPNWASTVFLVRTRGEPLALRGALRNAVQSVDRSVPVNDPSTLGAQIERAGRRNVITMQGIGALGMFGLLMATLGVYGVVAYSVAERTREIGIRMALGATRGGTFVLMLRQGLRPVVIGLAIGMTLGVVTMFGMRELLYGTHPFDLSTCVVVGTVLFASSLLATLIPSRRALRINPMEALRNE